MPYPNEHSARLHDPDKYDRIRRENDKFGPGIDAIWGILNGVSELASIHFDSSKFTPAQAKAWLKEHDHKTIKFEAATEAAFRIVYSGGQTVALSGPKVTKGKQPYQRFRKELIRVGKYVKAVDGIRFRVTAATLSHWVATFARMKKNGCKVPVPLGHTTDAKENRGWLRDLFIEGESLVGVIDLIGEDGIACASRTDVSIFVPPEFTDGKGEKHTHPIMHVALCTDPVIPGLADWQAVAASLTFTREQEAGTMDWKEIAKALGIEDGMTDETAQELILAGVATITTARDDAVTAKDTAEKALKALKATSGRKKLDPEKPEPDPLLLSLTHDNREMKLNALVTGGVITPDVRDKLLEEYATEDAIKLELSHGGDVAQFDRLIAILAKNDPKELKELTGPQTVELSHGKPNEDRTGSDNPLIADAERRAEAAKPKA